MRLLIDTNIAIHLRDLQPDVTERLRERNDDVLLSVISLVELFGGLRRDPINAEKRRLLLDEMLQTMSILDFRTAEAAAYQRIVVALGFNRPKLLDRMIAAQAIIAHTTLITMNPTDFTDIPGLQLEVWPIPATS